MRAEKEKSELVKFLPFSVWGSWGHDEPINFNCSESQTQPHPFPKWSVHFYNSLGFSWACLLELFNRKNVYVNLWNTPSLNIQSCIRRPLCSTLKFENLSISLFWGKKNEKKLKKKSLKEIMQLFCFADSTMLSKFFNFFVPENMKKLPSKIAHNRPNFFFSVLARLTKRQKTEIPYHQKPLNAGLGT